MIHRDHLMNLPLFGELRGKDDPEKIIALNPDLVFKTGSTRSSYATSGPEADTLQQKTGVPVVAFPYGSLRNDAGKEEMITAIRLIGTVLGREDRAEAVIAYIEDTMADLESRTGDIPVAEQTRVYGVLPYNFYTVNHGTVLADAYFVGKVLYPDRFEDVDPAEKADEIYSFLLGETAFDLLNSQYGNPGFSRIPI